MTLGSSTLGFCYEGLGIHVHARAHSLNPLRYDSVAGTQAARDDPSVIDPVAHSDGSNVNFVVGLYDRNLISPLQFRHRALRNQERAGLFADHSPHLAVAARSQNIVWVGEKSGDTNRAGGLVHLAVSKIKSSFVRIRRAFRQNQLEP